MKTFKKTVLCLTMLMVCMNVMAQRETLTFNGIMANFPHGGSAETVLTIKPDGGTTVVVRCECRRPSTGRERLLEVPQRDGVRCDRRHGGRRRQLY